MESQPDMPNCMSKLMLLGMSLTDAVLRSTVKPAKEIGRYPELGTLGAGRDADITVLDLRKGVFALKDAWGAKRLTTTAARKCHDDARRQSGLRSRRTRVCRRPDFGCSGGHAGDLRYPAAERAGDRSGQPSRGPLRCGRHREQNRARRTRSAGFARAHRHRCQPLLCYAGID